jgi:hypothetical protein
MNYWTDEKMLENLMHNFVKHTIYRNAIHNIVDMHMKLDM